MSTLDAADAFLEALSTDDARDLYERAPCGFVSTSEDGSIIKVNETFLTWTGFGRDDLVGVRRFPDLLNVGGKIYYETHYAPTLQMQGRIREVALDIVRRDGTRLAALVNSVVDVDVVGRSVIRSVIFDATERRSYERELLVAKERAEASEASARALASALQRTLIPPGVPTIDGLEVAAAYRPAGDGSEVGGDFYDVFQTSDDDWFVVVGDVCGKGVPAAIVTSAARYTLRAAAMQHTDLTAVLTTLNDVLRAHESQRFCTLGVVRLRRTDGRWSAAVASAGHPPVILRAPDGSATEVDASGTLSGVLRSPEYRIAELDLLPGTALVLYTDGVTEGRRHGEFYGEQRLLEAVAEQSGDADAMVADLLADLLDFQGERPRDDIVILAVRVPD